MKALKSDLIVMLVAVLAFAGTAVLHRDSADLIQSRPKVLPPKILNNISLGFKTVLSDSLWIRVLQSDDFCENPRPKANFNPAMMLEDALKVELQPSRCEKGWVYSMIELITDLNPRFQTAYKFGGLILSIGVDDREGARLIFEKGVRMYPEDWQLIYRAAYHYIFEIQDGVRAKELLKMAAQVPDAPGIVSILAARLESGEGKTEMAISTLTDYLKTAKQDTEGYHHAKFRLEELKKKAAEQAKKNQK